MTKGKATLASGKIIPFELAYDDFQRMYRSASLNGEKIKSLEIEDVSSAKGNKTITFG